MITWLRALSDPLGLTAPGAHHDINHASVQLPGWLARDASGASCFASGTAQSTAPPAARYNWPRTPAASDAMRGLRCGVEDDLRGIADGDSPVFCTAPPTTGCSL